MMSNRVAGLLGLILIAGLLLRLSIAWQPVPLLVEKTLPDDAFYYFAIARNVISGNGVSVDGVTPTNGFHPLWALLLLLPYMVQKTGDIPIHLSLSLAAIIDVLSAWIAFDLVRRITRQPTAGLLAALLYACNPLAAMESQNGLETALGTFMFALTSWLYLAWLRAKDIQLRYYALFGLCAGLMLLARTDTLFLLLVIGVDGVLRLRHNTTIKITGWAVAGTIIALLLLPWFWWNLTTFGTIVQSSAVAAPRLIRYSLTTPIDQGVPFATVFQQGYQPIINLSFILAFRYAGLAFTAAGVTLLISRILSGRFPSLSGLQGLWLPVLGGVLPVLVHTFVRWYPRSWYYVPLAWAAAVVAGAIMDRAAQSWPQHGNAGRYLRTGGVALLCLILALQGLKMWSEGFYGWQRHMLAAAIWAADTAPGDAVVASFNSGLQAYYGQRPVVNLDGVVNWEAVQAMEQRQLLGYARQRGATHLVDFSAYIFASFHPFFEEGFERHLQPVRELSPRVPAYGVVTVYEIR